MSARGFGCHYCFKTLNSQDKRPRFRKIVECGYCHKMYHEVCWRECGKCPCCGGYRAKNIQVSLPKPSRPVTKYPKIYTKPSRVIYLSSSQTRIREISLKTITASARLKLLIRIGVILILLLSSCLAIYVALSH